MVFGSHSEVLKPDQIETGCMCVTDGVMIADWVMLLPCCKLSRHMVMGSSALGMHDTEYRDGST
jgi:hypothetical protein